MREQPTTAPLTADPAPPRTNAWRRLVATAANRWHAPPPDADEIARVEDTIPRGRSERDARTEPAVNPWVWLDHVRVRRPGRPHALDRLVSEYDAYARNLAGRLDRGREPREDLDQLALEALVVALQRFEPDRSLPFPAFARPTITGTLRRHIRDHGWLIHVPRSVHEFASAEHAAVDQLTELLGRPPSTEELAAALDMDVHRLHVAQDARAAREPRSLDAPLEPGTTLGDQVGARDQAIVRAAERLAVRAAIGALDDADRELLRLSFQEGWTQARIGEHLGVSQMQVSRLLASLLGRIRARAV